MDIGLAGLLLILFAFAFFYGTIKAFQRNWLLALLLLLFLFPALVIWALLECFTGPVVHKPIEVRIVNDREE